MRSLRSVVLALAACAGLAAQGTVLDLAPGSRAGRWCEEMVGSASGLLFFTFTTPGEGEELWRSDGTTAGTFVVRDLFPGPAGSEPRELLDVGGTLYFTTLRPPGLWRSDGTEAGTQRLFEGSVRSPRAFAGAVWFRAGAQWSDLWRSDGTTAGTTRMRAFPFAVSDPTMAVSGATLYFGANDGTRGLWRSDGTTAGTTQVYAPVDPGLLTGAGGGRISFVEPASSPAVPPKLWWSDGTTAGTRFLRDMFAVPTAPARSFTSGNGRVFFRYDDGLSGDEPWTTDGVTTRLLRDVHPGAGSAFEAQETRAFASDAGAVLFAASDGAVRRLWRSDGSPGGTVAVADFANARTDVAVLGGRVFFTASTAATGAEPWVTDGTPASARLLVDALPGPAGSQPYRYAVAAGRVWFVTETGELWCSDGSTAGTTRVAALPVAVGSAPRAFARLGRRALLTTELAPVRYELWSSDGTVAGTERLAQLGMRLPPDAAQVGERWLFAGSDARLDVELWASDGTAAGTARVLDANPGASLDPHGFVAVRGAAGADFAIFFGRDASAGYAVWRSDGTAAGTSLLFDPDPGSSNVVIASGERARVGFGGAAYFYASGSLWRSDGTASGSVAFSNLFSTEMCAVGSTLFFAGVPHTAPDQGLWRSDGTSTGTVELRRFPVFGTVNTGARELVDFGGVLLFSGFDPGNGRELWRSDGSAAGTQLVADLNPGAAGSEPRDLVVLDSGVAVFSADDGVHGREPWITDGTAGGTRMLLDLRAGPEHGVAGRVVALGTSRALFTGSTAADGVEPWSTDGTVGGTAIVADLAPGSASSNAREFTAVGAAGPGALLFVAGDDPLAGREPIALPLGVTAAPLVQTLGVACTQPGGTRPAIGARGAPVLGNAAFSIELRANAHRVAALLLGTVPEPTALPGGCTLHLAASLWILAPTDADGDGGVVLSVPTAPSLLGERLLAQFLVVEPGGPLLGSFDLSDALVAVIGR